MGNESNNTQPLFQGAGLPQRSYHPVSYQAAVSYHPAAVSYHPIALHVRAEHRRSPLRRFLVSFLVAVGLFALLKTAVRHWHWHGHGHSGYWGHRWEIPQGIILDRCDHDNEWAISDAALLSEGFQHSAETSFEILLTADTVLMLSRHVKSSWFGGSSALSGNLDITTSPDLDNTARVVVSAFHGHKRPDMMACLMTGAHGETGVGVFMEGVSWGSSSLIKIQLVLPKQKRPVHLKALVADLPNFAIHLGNLTDAVEFKSVALRTSNSAMSVKSLSAGDVKLHTSNAAISMESLFSASLTLETSNAGISGTFNTSGSLYMSTSNAPIAVTVGLESLNTTRTTSLEMHTSNNRLDAAIELSTPATKGGRFDVEGTTSNGPLNIIVPTSPRDAALGLRARTSNAVAEVTLSRAYEGAFWLATSIGRPVVERLSDKDEDGEDKDKRRIEYEDRRIGGRGGVRGWIYKEEEAKMRGSVSVYTSNAPLRMFV